MSGFRLGTSFSARPIFLTSQRLHDMDPRLVVLDTNVFINALQAWRLPRHIPETPEQRFGRMSVEWIEQGKADLCFSDYIAKELRTVLPGPRLRVPHEIVEKFVRDMEKLAKPEHRVICRRLNSTACGDPADLPIIATAMTPPRWASKIITCDRVLLGMLHFQGIQMNHPAYFVGLSKYPGQLPKNVKPAMEHSRKNHTCSQRGLR